MPHFVVEYSSGVERLVGQETLMGSLYEAAVASGVMNPQDIKIRALAYDTFRFEGNIQTFIHVTVSLLAGRNDTQKEHLALLLRESLDKSCGGVDSISIDIRDMDPVAYKKRLKRTEPPCG
ncbi:MAG: 5-carboxymethyl-2-hydroxymuconate Delta-isomerase [Phyllobacterium sp.]